MTKSKFDPNAAFNSIITAGRVAPDTGGSPAKGRPKSEKEIKRRITLAVLPSLYSEVQKIAYVERSSVSDMVNKFFEQCVKENASKLEEYENIINK